jgi:hypothetical protein
MIDANDILIAKRTLANDLRAALQTRLEFSDAIEKKAIELFKFSSAILGIASGLGISLTNLPNRSYLLWGFVILAIIYILQIVSLWLVLRPSTYTIPPGLPRVTDTYDSFIEDYIGDGEQGYLDQIIIDLAGIDDISGAIEDAEDTNRKKINGLIWMGLAFASTILGLLVMSAVSLVYV